MKKLIISKKSQEVLEENGIVATHDFKFECPYGGWRTLDISQFRFYLHKLVELNNFEDKDKINEEISANNFTSLIMREVIEIV